MLVINKPQINDLELKTRDKDLRMLLDHALKYYASRLWEMSESDMLKMINRMVNTCIKYGISNPEEMSVYVLCAMELGENFEDNPKYPWAKEILTDKEITSSEKMDELDETVFN